MARQKSSPLSRKAERLALPIAKRPVFASLGDGVSIGYRRNAGAGVWVARRSDGKGGKFEGRLGLADDYADANGADVLSFAQACAKAFAFDPNKKAEAAPVTIDAALKAYEADLTTRGADTANVRRVRVHLSPHLLNKMVAELTVQDLKGWRDSLSKKLAAASVNRTTTPLKAALNMAADNDEGATIKSRAPWEIGFAALPGAEQARNVVISTSAINKIVAASYGHSHAFGLLVEVLAVTGCRYIQASRLVVSDLQDGNGEPRLLVPSSKKGRGVKTVLRRSVAIPKALAARLRDAAGDRLPSAPLLVHRSGDAWQHAEHVVPFREAVSAAELEPSEISPFTSEEISSYALRHSSIVRDLMAGLPIRIIAAKHDTSVAMIERNYSDKITDHTDSLFRASVLEIPEISPKAPRKKSPPSEPTRPPMDGQCSHGHDYQEFPPYRNKAGAIVCAECARIRTAKNKASKRGSQGAKA